MCLGSTLSEDVRYADIIGEHAGAHSAHRWAEDRMLAQRHAVVVDMAEWGAVALGAALAVGLLLLILARMAVL